MWLRDFDMQEIDLKLNRIPKEIQKIHLIAVCGTGMAALASVLKEKGYEVTGSDHKTYPPMSDFLARKNIPIYEGYQENNLSGRRCYWVLGCNSNLQMLQIFIRGIRIHL